MGILDRLKKKDKPLTFERWQKKKQEAEIKAAYEKEYYKSRIKAAKKRGRIEGIGSGGSKFKKIGNVMDDFQELMVGKDFEFGPVQSSRRKKKKRDDDLRNLI